MSPTFVRSFFLFFVTIFLLIDYFPDMPVLSSIPGIVFFIGMIVYLILGAMTKKKNINRDSLKAQGSTIGYIVVVGVLFMLFGEGSQGIIIFSHGVFFFSLFIALFELVRDYSFFKRNEARPEEH